MNVKIKRMIAEQTIKMKILYFSVINNMILFGEGISPLAISMRISMTIIGGGMRVSSQPKQPIPLAI